MVNVIVPTAHYNYELTEEQVVGEWVDGKLVYERTYSGIVSSESSSVDFKQHFLFACAGITLIDLWGSVYFVSGDIKGYVNIPYATNWSGAWDGFSIFQIKDSSFYPQQGLFALYTSSIFVNQPFTFTYQYFYD